MDAKDQKIQSLKEIITLLKEQVVLLEECNGKLEKCNSKFQEFIIGLQERITELERRLNSDSRNSSKPPSSDGLRRQSRTQSLRKPGQRPSGGQKGHKGTTLKQVECPDQVVLHPLENCPNCTSDLSGVAVERIIKRQVVELPSMKAEIIEHQVEVKHCKQCKLRVRACFPLQVKAPIQYGESLKALAIYLQAQHFLPEGRLKSLLEDLFGVSMSSATIEKISHQFSHQIEGELKNIWSHLIRAPIKHVDETGFRIGGKTHWLHVLSNEERTYYRPSEKRGEIFSEVGRGTVVHDHFKSYYKRMEGVSHALCNAHHLRELQALMNVEQESWSIKMWKLLHLSNKLKVRYEGSIPTHIIEKLSMRYEAVVEEGLIFHENKQPLPKGKRGRRKRRIGHNLLVRLRDFKQDTLRFIYKKEVPFTNNQAERDIRMMKVKQKISGCFRSEKGAVVFCRIRSFLSTLRKQEMNALDSIKRVLKNEQCLLT